MLEEAAKALELDSELIDAYLALTEALVEVGKTKSNDSSLIEQGIKMS